MVGTPFINNIRNLIKHLVIKIYSDFSLITLSLFKFTCHFLE